MLSNKQLTLLVTSNKISLDNEDIESTQNCAYKLIDSVFQF